MKREILNIVNRVLTEEVSGRIKNAKRRLFETKEMCSECGSGRMVEGECMECGYMKEDECVECGYSEGDMMEGTMCSECGGGPMVEGECSECGYSEGEMTEKLHGNQSKIDRNKNGKIDKEDFRLLRNKKEMKERLYGNQHRLDKNKNNKIDSEDLRMLRKEDEIYQLTLDESTGEKFFFNENDIINIIENIVLEEKKKKKKTTKKSTKNVTKDSQSKSKKDNDDYIDSVVKKMKDYLKGGSKGNYDMSPKHFPKGNGDLEKMDKMAYVPSDLAHEYIDNFTGAGLENLDYDEIHPNDEWVTMNLVGSSRTGNNPKWANSVETEVGKKRNKIRKNNLLAKIKRQAYQKDDQPVKIDGSGVDLGDNVGSLLKKYSKGKITKESKEETNVLNEITEMKKLFSYNKKTQ